MLGVTLAALSGSGCASQSSPATIESSAPNASAPTGDTPPTPTAATTPVATPTPTPTPDPAQDPILISTARAGDLAGVQQTLAAGASVTAADADGQTALIAAAYGNHVDVAATLIAAGADVNAKDTTTQSAYLISTSEVGDDPRLLVLTLANGADVASLDRFNGTGLIRAADRGFPVIIATLLTTPIDVNHINNLGWTALHEAIILGDGSPAYIEVVRELVAAGADVNLVSQRDGITPLQHAEDRGYTTIANILRDAGAFDA